MFFRRNTAQGGLVLVLDIESGSVGAALVQLTRAYAPRMLGVKRLFLPQHTAARRADEIARLLKQQIDDVLIYESAVAARLRNYAQNDALGTIDRVAVCLGAPWGMPNLSSNTPDFSSALVETIEHEVRDLIGEVPLSLHAGAESGALAINALGDDTTSESIAVLVRGETTELIVLRDKQAVAYATLPHGDLLLLRTLRAHGGLSHAEARSALALLPHEAPYAREPMRAAAEQYIAALGTVAPTLTQALSAPDLFVLSNGPAGGYLARALADSESTSAIFSQGGSIRALLPHHFAGHVSCKDPDDIYLLADAMLVDKKFSGI